MCYEIILQAYGLTNGWDLIARICANVRNFGEAGGTGPRDVAAGEVAAGLVIDQYAQTVIDAVGGDLLVFVLPRNATVIGPDAIGLLRGAPQPELARRFLDYVFSADGQRLLCRPAGREGQQYALYRLPVLPAVYHEPYAPATRPYSYAGSFVYDDKLGSRRWNIVNDMIGTCLIEAHAELARAWKRIIVEDCPADKMRQLGRLPASMEEIEALSGRWKDARFRLETTRRWAREAQERYRRLSAGA
jgi:ABC-type Fe3+ transport system substrate-binding protein